MIQFSEKELHNLAESKSFEKGKDYFQRGCVKSIHWVDDKLIGLVEGNYKYNVKLWRKTKNDSLNYDCSCPYSAEGYFCKHLVAFGLAYLNNIFDITEQPNLKTSLENLSKEDLIQIVLKEIEKNPKFLNTISKSLNRKQSKNDILNLKTNFEKAFYINNYIDYEDADDYFSNLEEEVLEPVKDRLKEKEITELIYYAFDLAEKYFEKIDDSDGDSSFFIESLTELLLKAYKIHKTDYEEVAEKLLKRILDFNYYDDVLEACKEILGENGLAYFYKLVWEKWNALLPLTKDSKLDYNSGRSILNSLLEAQAKTIEELVYIYQKDLSHSWDYLKIAKAYNEHKQNKEALEWLQKGLTEFGQDDSRLTSLMAEILHSEGKSSEASKIIFEQFQINPRLETFQKLKEYAEAAEAWELFRQRIFGIINENRKKFVNLFIEIMLYENKPEAALQEAKTYDCRNSLWLKIANALGPNQIEEAIIIYKKYIEEKVSETNNKAYEEGKNYLVKVQVLTSQKDFENYLIELKQKFKLKKNFIKILETKF